MEILRHFTDELPLEQTAISLHKELIPALVIDACSQRGSQLHELLQFLLTNGGMAFVILYDDLETKLDILTHLTTRGREVKEVDDINKTVIKPSTVYLVNNDSKIGITENILLKKSKKTQDVNLSTVLERYESLYNSLTIGYCILEVIFDENDKPIDLKYLESNSAFEELTGWDNAIGKTICQLKPDVDKEKFEVYAQVVRTGQSAHFEHYKGLNRVFDMYVYKLGNNPGRNEVGVLFTDVTEQRRQSEILLQSEQNYKSIINQALTGIVKINKDGMIIFTNDHFCKMLGYSEAEILGKNFVDFVYPKDHAKHFKKLNSIIKNRSGYIIEKRMVNKAGLILWVNNYNSPIFDKDQNLDSITIVSADISRLKAMDKQKDEFIGMISHELKTPLTGIQAYGELLQEMNKNNEASILVEKLNSQINRLTSLVHRLLEKSKLSEGRYILQKERLNLNQLVIRNITDIQPISPHHRFITKLGFIPEIYAEPSGISQVFNNFISNAIKFSPRGSEIIISSQQTDIGVRINVRDFGSGIPPENNKKIFKRYFRINTPDNPSGFGLGLAISKNIIKLHGGKIGVENLNNGSNFYFILPYETEKSKK